MKRSYQPEEIRVKIKLREALIKFGNVKFILWPLISASLTPQSTFYLKD